MRRVLCALCCGRHSIELMAGINLFSESGGPTKKASAGPLRESVTPCIFISHRKDDIEKARQVGKYLKELDLNIYLDENDKGLQSADAVGDHAKVVEYIDGALDACTHFLGIITPNTRGSWWVPYELGMARRAGRECAHLIESTVDELPSYIQVGRILPDVVSLRKWLPGFEKSASRGSYDVLVEDLLRGLVQPPQFIPQTRAVSDLKFI